MSKIAPFILFITLFFPNLSLSQTLIWEESFDSLDTSLWNVIEGNGCPQLCFWGNSELQNYRNENVYTDTIPGEDGNRALVIEPRRENFSGSAFTSGRIDSEGKVEIQYGIIETRMMVPDLETGLWPAFWLLGADHAEVGWPRSGEIDMMEMGHRQAERNNQGAPNSTVNNYVGSNLIWYAQAACSGNSSCAAAIANDVNYNKPYVSDSSMANRFVTYRMYWNFNSIRFTVTDRGEEYDLYEAPFTISGSEIIEAFRKPYHLLVNLAVGGNFTDASSANNVTAPLPAKMYVDYVKVMSFGGAGEVSINGVVVSSENEEVHPEGYVLKQNYPNPFNPSTTISFEIPKQEYVSIKVYDLKGRMVRELANRSYPAGSHQVNFNAENLASGVYYYRLQAGNINLTQKMTLIK